MRACGFILCFFCAPPPLDLVIGACSGKATAAFLVDASHPLLPLSLDEHELTLAVGSDLSGHD